MSQVTPAYQLPADPFTDWRMHERPDFAPTARQRRVMDAVEQSIAEGLFYSSDVVKRAAEILQPTAEQLASGTGRVEGGDFGMDCYYARGALDAIKEHARNREALAELRLVPGLALGTVIFNNDFKRCYNTRVTEVSGTQVTVEFTRARNRYTATAPAASIRFAIERAHKKDARKDSYEDFVAARAGQLPVPTPREPAPDVSGLPLFAGA